MDTLIISYQGSSNLKKTKYQRETNTEDRGFGRGILKGVISNVTNDPSTMQEKKQRMDIDQMNLTIRHMQNELTKLRRNDNFHPNTRIPIQERKKNHVQG